MNLNERAVTALARLYEVIAKAQRETSKPIKHAAVTPAFFEMLFDEMRQMQQYFPPTLQPNGKPESVSAQRMDPTAPIIVYGPMGPVEVQPNPYVPNAAEVIVTTDLMAEWVGA